MWSFEIKKRDNWIGKQIYLYLREEYYSILKTSPLVRSLGVGLIRSVDAQKKMIYLTSYIPEEQLEQVNCLGMQQRLFVILISAKHLK